MVICCFSLIYLVILCVFLLFVFGILSSKAGKFRNGKYSEIWTTENEQYYMDMSISKVLMFLYKDLLLYYNTLRLLHGFVCNSNKMPVQLKNSQKYQQKSATPE